MAALAEARHDHDRHEVRPALFGLDGPDGTPRASTSRSARSSRPSSGIAEDKIEWTEAVSANREPFIQNGDVDFVVAHLHDQRQAQGSRLASPGPYYIAGQSILVLADNEDIKNEDDLVGQPVCSVTGSTPAANLEALGAEVAADRHLLATASSRCATAASSPSRPTT